MSNPLSSLFGKSPIEPLMRHMKASCDTVNLLSKFIDSVYLEDWPQASSLQQGIAQQENEADNLKKELRLHLPKSLFMPIARSDILELLSTQDQLANTAKDIAGIILGRKMKFPDSLKASFTEFLASAIDTADKARLAINELNDVLEAGFAGREVALVEKMITQLDELEHKNDGQEILLRASLFDLEQSMPPVDVVFLYHIIDQVGDIADFAQKVGSRLQILIAR